MTDKKRNVKKKNKRLVYDLLLLVCIAVLGFCAYQLVGYYGQKSKSEGIVSQVADEVVSYGPSTEESESQSQEDEKREPTGYSHAPIPKSVDFEALKAQNSEAVGWLFSENGVINYPLMQTDNNEYYLNHLISGKENINGSLFLDYLCNDDFSSRNTLIYGHSMKNGTMFATLLRYRNQAYYDAYPCFYLYTPKGNYRIDVFSGFETTADDRAYVVAFNDNEMLSLVSYLFSKSAFRSNVQVSETDRLVTLSTCAYSHDDARFLVVGKLTPLF